MTLTNLGVLNTLKLILFRTNIIRKVKLTLKSGVQHTIKNNAEYVSFWDTYYDQGRQGALDGCKIEHNTVSFKFQEKKLRFKYHDDWEKSKTDAVDTLLGTFQYQIYKGKYEHSVVVDIGANMGDSAIYFALRGAKQVYAFEPYKYTCDLASANIRLNKLENKITLMNEGVAGVAQTMRIAKGYKSSQSTSLMDFKSGVKIAVVTLKDIVDKYKLKDAVLKMDCEGSEYDIIMKADTETLRSFKKMMIEYHYGYLDIEKRLAEAGFKVRHTPPTGGFNAEPPYKALYIGFIYADIA